MSDGKTRLWRSFDELAQTAAFEEMLHREFPSAASEWTDEPSRRRFLKLMAASMALAGIAGAGGGCTRTPEEKIVPYVIPPEQLVPGRPLYFATAHTRGGFARGILVESHEGRPTKIEGNPDHPASLGATDVHAQASILDLYDPDRSQTVMRGGEVADWNAFLAAITPVLTEHRRRQGEGLRLLTRTITSPTLISQIRRFLEVYPKARWHQWEPINCDNAHAGAKLAFGQIVRPVYRFDRAKVIVSLDDNFLFDHPGSIRYARDFISGRRVRNDRREMNRLYVFESTPTITGAMADHRRRVRPSEVERTAHELATAVASGSSSFPAAADLLANRGAGLVVVGESQPPMVHALAHRMNVALGNIGNSVVFIDPPQADPQMNHVDSIRDLATDLETGAVQTLIIIGGNPVYDAPADLELETTLKNFSDTAGNHAIHLSSHDDETSFLCEWHLPLAHELESWGDARAFDGTASVIQPLIAPLYAGRSPIELMSMLLGDGAASAYEIIRNYWRGQPHAGDFESWWEQCVRDGGIPDTTLKPKQVSLTPAISAATEPTSQPSSNGVEIVFRHDPHLWDGQFATNAWLQELPQPLTKLSWDNAALMSPRTAARFGLVDVAKAPGNDVESSIIEISVAGRSIEAPTWILPGHPDDVITLHVGRGRTRVGRVGSKVGFNAYALRTSQDQWHASNVQIRKTGRTMALACTQNHQMMDPNGRDPVHVAPIAKFESVAAPEKRNLSLSLFPQHAYDHNKWGMVIDTNACIGCNACVIACQAENNIPVVGKDQVARGREMHWLRIDAYFGGDDASDPAGPYFQPLPCMHCENAPCEVVCPVEATVHDDEGVNNMVYNRCIGTRYCSNNCPYKVRHFNFFHYSKHIDGPLKLMMNPDVTVRYRGVMEKCTYCIQRINLARIDAKREDRAIGDGEVVTACAQACPTQAIFFGNLNDPAAAVMKLKGEPTNYGLLDELQTQPRTTYLPRFTNPHSQA